MEGTKYFFHRSAIIDDDLYENIRNLNLGEKIPVVFETAQGQKGPLAIGISMYISVRLSPKYPINNQK